MTVLPDECAALNHLFLKDVRARYPGDDERIAWVLLSQESPERRRRLRAVKKKCTVTL